MQERLKEHQEKLRKQLPNVLLKDLHARFRALLKFVSNYQEACNELVNTLKNDNNPAESVTFLSKHIEYRKKLLEILGSWINKREQLSSEIIFAEFDQRFSEIHDAMPQNWYCDQSDDRFSKSAGDKPIAIAIKTLKKHTLSAHLFFFRLANIVRKRFGKEKKNAPRWKQKIPVRRLTKHLYDNTLLSHFLPVADDALKNTALLAHEVWQIDDDLFCKLMALAQHQASKDEILDHYNTKFLPAITDITDKIEKEKKNLRPALNIIWDGMDEAFAEKVAIAGTLELPGVMYPELFLSYKQKRCRTRYTIQVKKRHNTLFALADDWKFNQEIFIVTAHALRTKLLLKEKFRQRGASVAKSMNGIGSFLEKTRDEITPGTMAATNKKLQQLKFIAGKDLHNVIIPNVMQMLQLQGFPELITETKNELISILSSKTRKRILIKGFDPAKPYRDKSLEAISLLELLELDIAGNLEKTIYQTRLRSLKELDDFRNRLQDLGRIVLFNLESALVMAEKQQDSSPGVIADEARAGMQRALERFRDMNEAFINFSETIQNDFDQIIIQFNDKLIELTDNKNVDKIRYRIIQSRAIKNRQHFAGILKRKLNLTWDKTRKTVRTYRKDALAGLQNIRAQLGIQEHSKDISIEVSDFLVKDHDRLQKLPFVYRRLFVNEPLTDKAFFHPRAETKKMLANAFVKWREGSFTATLIYGEKGSGISTFVYMFFNEYLDNSINTYKLIPQQRLQTEEDLLAAFGNSLQEQPFKSYNDFEQFVEKNAPFVFFVDKLHLFYLRQPAGFQLLTRLFEIISSTSRQVFWICSCGLYAANFLDKSVGLFGYFPQLIKMKSLETDKVRSIIMLRHNASGYKLHFNPSAADKAMKNFTRKTVSEQQALLREKFFDQINRLSQSNISFALQLWIHSSSKVADNTVYLDSLDTLDLSFVYNLPDEVVFGLHALVLHEVLDDRKLSEIMNIGRAQAYMMLMRLKDRGIVVQQNGMFGIHPLLYRQSLALLMDKNLVY